MASDKYALKVFNLLVCNQKISGPLVASYLLGLSNYYTLSDNIKSINLIIFWRCFLIFALYIYKFRSTIDDLI